MRHFFIYTNKCKDRELKETYKIKAYLERHGKICSVAEYNPDTVLSEVSGASYTCDIPEGVDCCIVLGGDGTMLQAARNVMGREIPLLGVNLGTLGYLAEVEKNGIDDALNQLIAGKYDIVDRMMLYGESSTGEHGFALNDIVLARCSSLQVMNFNIFVNGMYLNNYRADGIILCTPTGSTAYNMSAGGPIVEPSAKMILLTPICPHTFNSRTIVLSADDTITVELGEGKAGSILQAEASLDGTQSISLKTGDKINIKRADQVTRICRLKSVSFLEVLHNKLV
ncbi:MAG: NAD(+)/NADH kinase [Butyrivibrio sp.]|nr:NAD(+)/NADH kinase [Butyrivibrio sp.]